MRVLVTGIGGFVGPVAAAALRDRGHEVHGFVRRAPRTPLPGVALHDGDLLAPDRFAHVVADVAPDAVLHLAALSAVAAAEADPPLAYRVNVEGTLTVLAAVRRHAPRARVLAVGSSDAYGAVAPGDLPVGEDVPFRPLTVYGASKAAADVAAGQWARAYGLDVVRARPFNHTGPGQEPTFVCSALARQVAAIEAGRQEPVLRVGNADPVRDFSDVRDVVAGYAALLERGKSGEAYNLCRGEGVSIAEVIAILRTHARIPMRVWSDPALRRPVDAPRVVGTHARATSDTGWTPRIPLDESLRILLDDWRTRLAHTPAS
jgi:GDP-4-dehydro-6-deoxy-D-mannose reductase